MFSKIDAKTMGFKGGGLFLKKGVELPLDVLRGCIVIIDLSSILHILIRRNIYNETYYILEFIKFIYNLKKFGIIPVFVADGKPPEQKTHKISRKKKKYIKQLDDLNKDSNRDSIKQITCNLAKINTLQKKILSIGPQHTIVCKEICARLDVAYICFSNHEADTVIAALAKSLGKKEDKPVYVLSPDPDMLLFEGIKHIISRIDTDTFSYFNKPKIFKELNITEQEIRFIAFITGTDYNSGLYNATFASSYELVTKHGPFTDIDNFISRIREINISRVLKLTNDPTNDILDKKHRDILIPSYKFSEIYDTVMGIFKLEDISKYDNLRIGDFSNKLIIKKKENKPKNTLSNFLNIRYMLEYIDTITLNPFYSELIKEYSRIEYGINITE